MEQRSAGQRTETAAGKVIQDKISAGAEKAHLLIFGNEGGRMSSLVMIWTILGAAIIPALVLGIVAYVAMALAYQKALKLYDYAHPFFAWIPFLNTYALADAVAKGEPEVEIFGQCIGSQIFKFWWAIQFLVSCIPYVGSIAGMVIRVICLGHCMTVVYADMDDKTYSECQALGYVSALVSLIFIVQMLLHKSKK